MLNPSTFNAQGSRVIIVVIQGSSSEGAHGQGKGDETQFITKIR